MDVELADVKNIELSPGSIIAKITTSSSSVANLIELAAQDSPLEWKGEELFPIIKNSDG